MGRELRNPDYEGFWKALPDAALCRDDWSVNAGFRHQYREEIIGTLRMLHRLGLVWGATALHPQPPEECDLCGGKLADAQMFVDGVTNDGPWAIMCPKCFFKDGEAIGPLDGQLYLQVEPGKWRMVVGSDENGEDDTTLSLPKPIKRGFVTRLRKRIAAFSKPTARKRPTAPKAEPSRPMRCGTPLIWMGWVPPHRSQSGKWEPPPGNLQA